MFAVRGPFLSAGRVLSVGTWNVYENKQDPNRIFELTWNVTENKRVVESAGINRLGVADERAAQERISDPP